MTDIKALKALAEAAPAGPWYPPDDGSHSGMVFDCDLGSLLSYESIDTERDACVAYVAAANPAAVLDLIAELDSANARSHEVAVACATAEQKRDAFRAALEGAGYRMLDNMAERGPEFARAIGAATASLTMGIQQERDQLKAENEMLRGELGECCESLRGEMLQKFGGQLPDDMHPVTRREYDRDMAEIACYRAVLIKEADHES